MSEKPTYNQVNEQRSSAYRNQSGENPTVLVDRSDGRITTGRLNTDTQEVEFAENGQDWAKPIPSLEALSDQRQEQLAAELAGVALRGEARSTVPVELAASPEVDVQEPVSSGPENSEAPLSYIEGTDIPKKVTRVHIIDPSGEKPAKVRHYKNW